MKKTIEVVAKKVNDAIEEGLRQLHATIDEVDVKVIEPGGFFKKAKVELTIELPDAKEDAPAKKSEKTEKAERAEKKPANAEKAPVKTEEKKEDKKPEKSFEKKQSVASVKTEPEKPAAEVKKEEKSTDSKKDEKQGFGQKKPKKKFEERPREQAEVKEEHLKKCEEFLTGAIAKMGVEGKVVVKEDNGISAVIETEDSAVIGYRGEVLDSLQYLASLALNEVGGKHIRFSLDALGYRARREETLKRVALKTADKCLKTNRKVSLEPMNSAERRIIHAALGDNEKVITRSEGHEPNRRVVVLPRR